MNGPARNSAHGKRIVNPMAPVGLAQACLALVFACSSVLPLSRVHAQLAADDATRAAARQLGADGIDAYQANDFVEASRKLERAYHLYAVPTLALWSARARMRLGRWVEAAERYRETARLPGDVGNSAAQRKAKEDAAEELRALVPRIPNLIIDVRDSNPTDVQLSFDGSAYPTWLIGVARPTNPGTHTLVAVQGSSRVELSVHLVEGENQTVPVSFHAPSDAAVGTGQSVPTLAGGDGAPEQSGEAASRLRSDAATAQLTAPNPAEPYRDDTRLVDVWKVAGVTALSLGAAGLASWGVSALVADAALDDCPVTDGVHWCQSETDASPYRTAKTVSAISFWAGTALTLGGLSLLLFGHPRGERQANAAGWEVGPTSVAYRRTF